MYLRLHTILLVFTSFYDNRTIGSSSFFRWPNAEQIIHAVCPSSKFCDLGKSTSGPRDPCCTECYCGDECVDGQECCFRDNNKTEFESCLYLRSKFTNFFSFTKVERTQFSYYVVTKSPNDGCHENKGSCDPSDTSTIYPVFSYETRKIYFNRDCAICHGVEEFEDPELYFMCDGLGSAQSLNFDEELSKFLEGDKSSLCFFTFSFLDKVIDNRICSIHSANSIENFINITNEDDIQNNYKMSIDDIADACMSNFFSPTFSISNSKVYPNPFCYLYGEGTHIKDPCFQSNGNPSGIQFMALLNPKVKTILPLQATKHRQKMDQVCVKTTNSSSPSQYIGCRPLRCPIGHIYDENSGCIFFGSSIFNNGRMTVFLNVILRSTLGIHIDKNSFTNMSLDYLATSIQLPTEWSIIFWGMSVNPKQDGELDRTDIIIILKLSNGDLARGIEKLKGYLRSEVVLLNSTYIFTIYGKTLSFEEVLPEDVLANIKCSSTRNNPEIAQIEADDVPDCWKMLDFSVNPYTVISIESLTKLYFCDVVELMSGEYRFLANDTLLFNNISSKYLHQNEFLIQKDGNNKKIIKACLDDSGLYRYQVSASFKDKGACLLPIGYFIMLSMFL